MPGQDIPIKLASSSSNSRIKQIGEPRLVNCRPEIIKDGRAQFAVLPRDGLRRVATLDGGPIRGLFEVDENRAYALSGSRLYSFSPAGSVRLVGAVPGFGPVYFARNRRPATQVACVSGGAAFLIQSSGVTRMQIPAPSTGFVSPIDTAFVDGYLLFITRTGQMHFTGIDNAADVSALNFITAEGNPDGLWRMIVRKREIWLFGDRTTEVWGATGDVDTPFQRLNGGLIETGIGAPHSLQHHSNGLTWIDDEGVVRNVMEGYAAARLSDSGVERSIQAEIDAGRRRAISSMSYSILGHLFYVISGADWTWAYDFQAQTWTEWTTEGLTRWMGEYAVEFAGRAFAGSAIDGALLEIRADVFKDDSRDVVMIMQPPQVASFPSALAFFNVRVDVTVGIGSPDHPAASPEDQNPTLRLRWSDDVGKTWSKSRVKPLGAKGRTRQSVRFNELGQSGEQGRLFEFAMSAARDRAFMAVTANAGQVSYP
jgi:hypothetical protein